MWISKEEIRHFRRASEALTTKTEDYERLAARLEKERAENSKLIDEIVGLKNKLKIHTEWANPSLDLSGLQIGDAVILKGEIVGGALLIAKIADIYFDPAMRARIFLSDKGNAFAECDVLRPLVKPVADSPSLKVSRVISKKL